VLFTVDPDLSSAFDFLSLLYEHTADEGFINLFHVDRQSGQRATAWAPLFDQGGLAALGKPLMELAPRGDVWFGVAPRRLQLDAGRRGGVADCVSIPAFWVDIDITSDAHKLPNLPPSYDAARQLVQSFTLPPSMVVRSGYGLQVWWRLRESLAAAEATYLLSRWQQTWERLADDKRWHIDNVSNIDRVMRLPGTYNFKGETPVLVTFRSQTPVYEHSDIAEALDPLREKQERRRTSTAHLAGSRFNNSVSCAIVLETFHLQLVRTDPNGDTHWYFPGSSNDTSCTIYAEDDHCTIWSETMASFFGMEIRRPYDAFGLWTWLKHHGDFALAHAELEQHGITDLGGGRGRQKREEKKATRLRVVMADAVTGRRVKWVWHSWLPSGKLTVLDGDPDVGKSTLSLDIAARITTGGAMPDGTAGIAAANVVLLSGEDDMDDTIIWRLRAAGADLSRVSHIQAAFDDDDAEMPLTIPRDLALVEAHVIERNAALIILDVLYEYLDERVDGHKDQAVRRALHHVRALAQHTGAAVLALRHFKKESTDKAIYRGGGSIGIIGAARAGWAVAYHPEDESLRVLVPVKMNLAIRPAALTYKLMEHGEYPCAYVDWRGAIEMSADDLLDSSRRRAAQEKEEAVTTTQRCIDAIELFLPVGRENAMLSHELRTMVMKAVGCSDRTYKSAHARIEFGRAWQVDLPDGTQGMMVWRPDPARGDFQ
jgi:hypothetical protein